MGAPTQKDVKNEPKPGYRYPDGGWGWIVVLSTGLSNFITIPVMQSFALIFQKRIEELNMSSTDLTTIINVNAAFGMSLGLITGPLIKQFGYRKVALFGAFCAFVGITSTSWADSFITFLITYSIITSMGTFLLLSSFSVAINTYFCERRGYASGLSQAFTGLGPVFMPQVITLLLRNYDVQGTTMILGALSAHSILAAQMLHPVKWHYVKVAATKDEAEDMLKQESKEDKAEETEKPRRRVRTITTNSMDPEIDIDTHSFYGGCETPLVSHRTFGSTMQISAKRKTSAGSFQRSISQCDDGPDPELSKRINHNKDHPWMKSEGTINLGSSVKIFEEKSHQLAKETDTTTPVREKSSKVKEETLDMRNGSLDNFKNDHEIMKINNELKDNGKREKFFLRWGPRIVAFFDLDLLTDPGYVILMLGMSLAICAELNFSLFTPLILRDYGFSLQQTATVMSVVGTSDIIFRFLAPFIGAWLKFTAQNMYLMSLLMLITSRTSLMIFHDYTSALIVGGALGVAKGFRTVYMSLVIPDYVPLYRLPSANGLQNLVNCMFIMMSIPLMAAVHDTTGSYNWCIAALNAITFSTVCIWTVQLIYKKCKAKKEAQKEVKEQA